MSQRSSGKPPAIDDLAKWCHAEINAFDQPAGTQEAELEVLQLIAVALVRIGDDLAKLRRDFVEFSVYGFGP